MLIPIETNTTKLEVKKSRFIATAFFCDSFIELKNNIQETRKNNPQARHVVHSAVLGDKNSIQYSMSDDREPKNTAGRPSLEVLKGSGITNIGVIIVRYFGGTLLGTNGLVHAYSDSTKLVLETLKTKELIETVNFAFKIPYDYYQSVKYCLEDLKAFEIIEKFETIITISGELPKDNFEKLKEFLTKISSGKINLSN